MRLKWSQFNVVVQVTASKRVVYNTATRSIVLANSEVIDSLRRNAFDEVGEGDISRLEKAGVIVGSDLDEVAQMEYSIEQTKYGRMRALSMFVCFSSECNLRCAYCFQDYRTRDTVALSLGALRQLLRFVDREVDERKLQQLNVVFFGGEPLMNPEVVIAAAEELNKRKTEDLSVDVSLITNGTLLNGAISRMLAGQVGHLQVTLDGPKRVHDARRPYTNGGGTYEDIMRNLTEAIDLFASTAVHSVVDSETVAFVAELWDDLEGRGLKQRNLNISFAVTYPTQRSLAVCSHPVDCLDHTRTMADLFSTAIGRGWRVPQPFLKGPCGRVQMDFMAVDEKLQVYKCPGEIYGPRPDGVIEPDGRLHLVGSNWFESVSYRPQCVDRCVYGPICYGGCRWLAGGAKRIFCGKQALDETLGTMLAAYVTSKYQDKLSGGTTGLDAVL